jgi:nucleoid-associated protein YgaU
VAADAPFESRSDSHSNIDPSSISPSPAADERFANETDHDRFSRNTTSPRAEPSQAAEVTRQPPQPVFTNPPATPATSPAMRPPLASLPAGPATDNSLPSRSSGYTSQPRIVADPPAATTAEEQEAWRMARRDPPRQTWSRPESPPGVPASIPTNPGVQAGATKFVRHRVVDGDSLASLAEKYLGSRLRYMEIFNANRHVLASPDLLPIGIELLMPTPTATPATALPRRGSNDPRGPSSATGWEPSQHEMVPIPADVLPHLRR